MLNKRISTYVNSSLPVMVIFWIVISSVGISIVLNFIQSFIWLHAPLLDLLKITIIDSLIIALIISPLAIRSIYRKIKLEEQKTVGLIKLREEEKFSAIAEKISDIIFLTDEGGKITYISGASITIFGFLPDEMVGHVFTDFLIESEIPKAVEEFSQTIATGHETKNLFLLLKRKDGTTFSGELNASLFITGGNIFTLGTLRDITVGKKQEEELISSEHRNRILVEAIPDLMFRISKEGILLDYNPGVEPDLYLPPNLFLGKNIVEVLPPSVAEKVMIAMLKAFETGSFQKFEYSLSIGNENLLFEARAVANYKTGEAVFIVRDITESKRNEKKLHDNVTKLQTIIKNVPILLFSFDKNGIFTFSDGYALKGMNLKPGEVVGLSVFDVYHDRPDILRNMHRAIAGETFTVLVTIDENIFDAYFSPLYDEYGNYNGTIGVAVDITERKKVEVALHEREKDYKELIDGMNETVWIIDLEGNIVDVNKTAVEVLGYSKEELLAIGLQGIDSSLTKEQIQDLVNSMPSRKSQAFETSHKTKNGISFPVEIDSSFVNYRGKKVILSIARDITDRKRSEAEIHEREELFRIAFDNAPTGMSIVGAPNFNYLAVNPLLCEMFGYTREEFLSNNIRLVTHPEDEIRSNEWLYKKINNLPCEVELEKRYIHKDGHIVWGLVRSQWTRNADGSPHVAVAHILDITQRKLADIALRESEYFLQKSQEGANIGSYYLNVTTGIWIGSPMLDKLFGIDSSFSKTVEGWLQLIHPDDREEMVNHLQVHVLENRNRFNKEYRIVRLNDEEVRWVHGNGDLEFDVNSSTTKLIGTIQDITRQKNSEIELLAAKEKAEEMNRVKSFFFANMSHELRTPFVSILGFSEILKDGLTDPDDILMAEGIFTSSKRFIDTLNKILTVTKLEFDELEPLFSSFDLEKTIDEVIGIFMQSATQKGLYLKKYIYRSPLIVKSDEGLVREILTNLVSNSIKFTHQGGVEILVRKKEFEEKEIIIEVCDSGIGIPSKMQNVIWQEFRQASEGISRSFEGTGLGLTIAKKYTEGLGGSINLISKEGKGSRFIVDLPIDGLIEKKQSIITKKVADKFPQILLTESDAKKRILYVEDDEFSREVVKRWLSKLFTIDLAKNADMALQMVKEFTYDIILMDINLGHGIDGVALADMVKQMPKYANTPIIALTAYASESDKDEFLSKGMSHYISKPFTSNDLISLLSRIVNDSEIIN